jgi:peptide/nickel transport system substrate-binding protein
MVPKKLIASALCVASMAVGCGPAGGAAIRDGQITIALPGGPASLDPATSSSAVERHVLLQIYDRLVELDSALQPQPGGLSTDFETSPDGKAVTFTLRQGVSFHNGEQFNAQAVQAHFDRLEDPGVGSPYLEDFVARGYESVEVVDDYTVRFHLTRPSPFFLSALADPAGGGIPAPNAALAAGRDFATQPVGSGPFALQSWSRGDAITLVRFDDYWDRSVRGANTLVFRGFADSTTAQTQFIAGQVDVITRLSPPSVTQAQDMGARVISEPGIETLRVFFNSTSAPFDDERLRRAVSAAIDRDVIRRTVVGSAGVTAGQPLAPIGIYQAAQLPVPARDTDRAKELLAEAGHPDGFTFDLLTYADNQEQARAALLVAAQLETVGITARIQPVTQSALLGRISKGGGNNYQATMLGGGAGNPDPVPYLYTNLGANASSGFGNASTAAMEEAFQAALTAPDDSARIEAMRVVNREVEQVAATQVSLWFYNSLVGSTQSTTGLSVTPTGILDVRKAVI